MYISALIHIVEFILHIWGFFTNCRVLFAGDCARREFHQVWYLPECFSAWLVEEVFLCGLACHPCSQSTVHGFVSKSFE